MPWDGYQKPPRSCPSSEDKVVASLWGLLLSLSLLSAVPLLWVQRCTSRCTLTHTPHTVLMAQGLILGHQGAKPNPTSGISVLQPV